MQYAQSCIISANTFFGWPHILLRKIPLITMTEPNDLYNMRSISAWLK